MCGIIDKGNLYWSSFFCRENRYLLFLTENYAALQVFKHYIQEVVGLPAAESSDGHTDVGGAGGLEEPGNGPEEEEKQQKWLRKMEPVVLFGSSFPKDKEYTQVCVRVCVYVYLCLHASHIQFDSICSGVS